MSNKAPEVARLEIKFVAYEDKENVLLRWLNLHPAGFTSPYPERWVNNVYFDTHNNTAYVENLSGASSRTKVRYRWYGKKQNPGAGTLEIKCKRNYFGWKLRYNIQNAPYEEAATWRKIRNLLSEQLSPEGKLWLHFNPFPVLINRYHRKYFLSSDKKIRITVDTKQEVWDQRFKPKPNYLNKTNLPKTLVVEVKFDRKDRELASQVLQGIPLRVSRHSKFMSGVKAIAGF
jgi:hypothetical protein